jgi:hypothetical protein
MTSLCKRAIKWFWLWPVVATVLGYVLAIFGIGGPEVTGAVAYYAAPFVGFGFMLLAGKHREEMRAFLKMFLVVGLFLNGLGFYELARWDAQGLMGEKLVGFGIWGLVGDLPVLVHALHSPIFTPYAAMTMVPVLLPLLITPSFLAMPVFWLWVVLSVLYVVLPPRAWGWMKHEAKRVWARVGHGGLHR